MNNRIPGIAAGSFAGALVASISFAADNSVFLQDAIQGSIAEVKIGQLAQEHGGSPDVRSLGSKLIADHSASLDQATSLARSTGAPVPTQPKPDAQREYDRLQALSGAAFDKEFIDHMIQDHETDIQKFDEQAKDGGDQVSQFAQASLPTLQTHLDIARKIEAERK